jgi:hypothetical protein
MIARQNRCAYNRAALSLRRFGVFSLVGLKALWWGSRPFGGLAWWFLWPSGGFSLVGLCLGTQFMHVVVQLGLSCLLVLCAFAFCHLVNRAAACA